jgi:hypothetical protein
MDETNDTKTKLTALTLPRLCSELATLRNTTIVMVEISHLQTAPNLPAHYAGQVATCIQPIGSMILTLEAIAKALNCATDQAFESLRAEQACGHVVERVEIEVSHVDVEADA